MVSTSVWHAVVWCSILRPGMLNSKCKNLALNIRDCVSIVGHGSSVLVVGVPLRNFCKFVLPKWHVSFLNET